MIYSKIKMICLTALYDVNFSDVNISSVSSSSRSHQELWYTFLEQRSLVISRQQDVLHRYITLHFPKEVETLKTVYVQVSKELIRFFDDPLCGVVARGKQLLTLEMQKATQLAINKVKNYGGVLVRRTWFKVLFLQTY